MSQVAHEEGPPAQHGGGKEEEDGDPQPEAIVQPKAPKPKTRRTKTGTTSKSKRRSVVDDGEVVAESSGTIRRPKSSMSTRSRPSRKPAAGSSQQPDAGPSDPRASRSDFAPPPRYPVPASGIGPGPAPVMPQANQARPFTHPARFQHPTPAAPYGWGPHQPQHWNQQGWNAYGQPIPHVRPQMPSLPGFRAPTRRQPPSPLEQEYAKLKKEIENIRAEQERERKEKEKIERAKLRAAKRAAEREAIRKKTIEEIAPLMEQYLRMTWRDHNIAPQDTHWDPSGRNSRIWSGYDAQSRGIPRNTLLEREHGSNSIMDEFSQFLQRKKSLEEQWSYDQSMYGESAFGSSAHSGDLSPQPRYNPMTDPTLQTQIEATVADMMPRFLQKMQQGTNQGQSHQPLSRNFAAEAADLYQIFQIWNEQSAHQNEQLARAPTPKSRKAPVDSGYASVANAEASSNSSRPRKTKARKKASSRKLREEANEQAYAEEFQAEEAEFEMIPGRKPAPYGYSGIWAPDPPLYP